MFGSVGKYRREMVYEAGKEPRQQRSGYEEDATILQHVTIAISEVPLP